VFTIDPQEKHMEPKHKALFEKHKRGHHHE
jgi:hypothetical protein